MVSESIIAVLRKYLSSYEVKSYLALMERNELSVAEVASIAGIPRASAYGALEKLMARGMCVSLPGRTRKFRAADPAIIEQKLLMEIEETRGIDLQTLRKKEKELTEKAESEKKRVRDLVHELHPRFAKSRSNSNPLNYIEIIKDSYQIHKRFLELIQEAREEILVFTKPPYSVPREGLAEQFAEQVRPLARGVRIKGLYEIPKDPEERGWWLTSIEEARRHGEEARMIEELPMKMGIFDENIVIYALEDPVSKQPTFTTLVVEHHSLAKSLKILFETMWQRAHDVPAEKAPRAKRSVKKKVR
jgi:sugar-specific transcriptional regulator TrmB